MFIFKNKNIIISKHFNADLLLLLFITHGGLEVTSHPDWLKLHCCESKHLNENIIFPIFLMLIYYYYYYLFHLFIF